MTKTATMEFASTAGPKAQRAERPLRIVLAAIVLIGVLRLGTLATLALTDNTEARYAGISWQMVHSGDWITPRVYIDGKLIPFWAKPPLFFWMTAFSFETCGNNEWGARLPNFLVAAAIVAATIAFGRRFWGPRVGALAGLILASSGLFFVLAGTCILDMVLAASVCLALMSFALFARSDGGAWWGHCFFLLLAVGGLAKGPIAGVLVGLALAAWIVATRQWRLLGRLPWLSGGLIFAAVACPWYLLAERATPGFLSYFLLHEHILRYVRAEYGDLYGAGRTQPYGASWVMLALTFLPWTLIFVRYGYERWKGRFAQPPRDKTTSGDGTAEVVRPAQIGASGAMATALRGHASQDMPTQGCGHGTHQSGVDAPLGGMLSAAGKWAATDQWLVFAFVWALTPAFFFTFCRQILVTYLLPGFPGLALATAVLVDRWLTSPQAGSLFRGLRATCVCQAVLLAAGLAAELIFGVPPWLFAGTALIAGAFFALVWLGHRRAEAAHLLSAVGLGTALLIGVGILVSEHWVEEEFSTKTILEAVARLPETEECEVLFPFGDEYSAGFYQEAWLGRRLEHNSRRGLTLLVDKMAERDGEIFVLRPKEWDDLEGTIRDSLTPIAHTARWVACRAKQPRRHQEGLEARRSASAGMRNEAGARG